MRTSEELAHSYEQVVAALSAVSPARRELLLAKTVLLLAQSPEGLRGVLAEAARDLPEPHLETT